MARNHTARLARLEASNARDFLRRQAEAMTDEELDAEIARLSVQLGYPVSRTREELQGQIIQLRRELADEMRAAR